tara:strand:- start:4484 stop:5134 length:651 start_codon:yes stop_codon:yes gene_type:complete
MKTGIRENVIMKAFSLAVLVALVSPGLAAASTIGFKLTLSGSTNTPAMTLENTSDTALLENINITIGDTSFNFDFLSSPTSPASGTSTLNSPDLSNGLLRSDDIDISFTGFDPGESSSWTADVDVDNLNTVEDYRTVLFNNGGLPNSVVTAAFSDAVGLIELLSFTMPDGDASATSFTFTATSAAPIPVPAALPLLLAALGGLGFVGWRRKRISTV